MITSGTGHRRIQSRIRWLALLSIVSLSILPRPARAECGTGCVAIIVAGVVAVAGLVVFAITENEKALQEDDQIRQGTSDIERRVSALTNMRPADIRNSKQTAATKSTRTFDQPKATSPRPASLLTAASRSTSALLPMPEIEAVGNGVALRGARLSGRVVRDESGRVSGYLGNLALAF